MNDNPKSFSTATAWAAEKYGFASWCPQSADEFIRHCNDCGFEIDVGVSDSGDVVYERASKTNVRESGRQIWVKHAHTAGEGGYAPKIIDGWALVAE
jgi:hypothetical protein